MNFTLKPVQLTSLEGRPGKLDFLGLFFELGIAAMAQAEPGQALRGEGLPSVETSAELAALEVPEGEQFLLGRPRATLRVDGRGSGSLEWQYAVDDGLWRPFDDRHELSSDPGLYAQRVLADAGDRTWPVRESAPARSG